MNLFEHFLKVLRLYSEAKIRIQIRIKVKGRIRIRIIVTSRIRIRINVMRIRLLGTYFYFKILLFVSAEESDLENMVRTEAALASCSSLGGVEKIPQVGWPIYWWIDITGCRPPPPLLQHVAAAGKNNLNEEITPLLPTGIGERYCQTISNLGHAELLRRCEIPL